MFPTLTLAALLALGTASEAGLPDHSAPDQAAPAPAADASRADPVRPPAPPSRTWLGLGVDAGIPNAAGASLVVKPWGWLRLHGGLAHDVIGHGYRGGLTLVPGQWFLTPTLDLSAGRFTKGDANRFAKGGGPGQQALLSRLTYGFASAQVGLELGSQRRFALFVRAGASYLRSRARGEDVTAFAAEKARTAGTTIRSGDVRLTALVPSASAGFFLFFL
jgi:hypothetical protein